MLIVLSPVRVITVFLILLLLVVFKGRAYWQDIARMCWRMKWLWLSLLILYGWFIPGSPVFFSELIPLALIPSGEGLTTGLLRALVLLNIITAVVLIIKTSSKQGLIVSIMWLMTPFKLFKIDTGVFAARLVLTMESVTDTEAEIRQSMKKKNSSSSYLQRGIETVADLLLSVEQQAKETSAILVALPQMDMPELSQWLMPLGLFIVLYMI